MTSMIQDAAVAVFDVVCAVCSALRVELAIFAATLACGVIIKFGGSQARLSRKRVGSEDDFKPRTHLHGRERSGVSNRPRANSRGPQPPPSSPGPNGDQLIEKIQTIIAPQTTQKMAANAIQVYASLREDLQLDELAPPQNSVTAASPGCSAAANLFQKAVRQCRCSGNDVFTSLVNSAVRCGQPQVVERLLSDMRCLGVFRTPAFYESSMKQLAGQKQHRLALAVYDEMVADGQEPSAVTCSCLINFAAEVGQCERAVQFFKKLEQMTTPSIRACMTVLRVYSKQLNWTGSLEVIELMSRRGITVDALVLNIVLATGVAADRVDEAATLLDEHSAISDVVSYNTLAKGYAQRSRAESAVDILERLRKRGLKPNAITFNTILDALVRVSAGGCESTPRSQLVKEVLGQMRASQLVPDKFTCSIIVRLVSREPHVENIAQALWVLREAGDRCEFAMRSTLYHSLFDAAATLSDDVTLMQIVAQMRQQHVPLNDTNAQLLRSR